MAQPGERTAGGQVAILAPKHFEPILGSLGDKTQAWSSAQGWFPS